MTIETIIASSEQLSTSQARLTAMQRAILLHGKPSINNTGSTIAILKVVRINGHDTTTDMPRMAVAAKADFNRLLGIVTAQEDGGETTVGNGSIGFYVDEGYVNADTSSFTAGAPLWFNDSGDLTATAQEGLPPVAYVQTSAVKASGGVLYFNRNGINNHFSALQTTCFRIGGISATALTKDYYCFASPTKMRVKRAYLLSNTTTSGSTTSNEYQFMLRNITDSLDLMSALKRTNAGEITLGTVFDLSVNQNQTIDSSYALNKVLRLQVTTLGTPSTSLASAEVLFLMEWQPVP